MAGQTLVFVTGDKELDAKLRAMPAALQKKFVRGGLRKGGKRVINKVRTIIRAEAYDTGALDQAVKVVALKRSRTRAGVGVLPKREVLFAKYAAKHDGKKPNPGKGETGGHYYAADIEFGNETHPPVRPFRRGLYENEGAIRRDFINDVTQFIADNKVNTKLPSLPRVRRT